MDKKTFAPQSSSKIIVELHVPDFQVAYDFYKILGFALAWMEETYMVLTCGADVLCFYGGSSTVTEGHSYFGRFPADSKKGYAIELILYRDDIHEFYRKVSPSVHIVAPLQDRPWGYRDFRVEDPFGIYLRISESYDTVARPQKIADTARVIAEKKFIV